MVRWVRMVMFRRKPLTRLLALGLVIVVCIIVYFFFESMPEAKARVIGETPYPLVDDAPAGKGSGRSRGSGVKERSWGGRPLDVERVAEYCNLPTQVEEGEEGEAPVDYQLLSAFVVIRHGDRTPMSSFLNVPPPSPPGGCTMDADFLQTVPELRHFLRDMAEQKERQRKHGDFASWSLHPQHQTCGSSQLTGQGALQHLFNGLSLRRKYGEGWGLFSPPFSPLAHLAVHSTVTSRTYQSAVAFIYGLLPRFDLSQVHVRASPNVMFCRPSLVPAACCSNLGKLRQEVDRAVRVPRAVDSAWQAAMPPLARIFGVKVNRLPGPTQLIDILQGHACHNLSLPCGGEEGGGGCVTPTLLEKLWALVDGAGQRSSQQAVFNRYSRTVTHSLLLEMLKSMQETAHNRSAVRFTLYSGHDLTMTPLLQTLGLYEGKWPPYATRLVWELYRRRSAPRKHYLRVLHNGRDMTSRVRFCQGHTDQGMCALKRFEDFVVRGNLEVIGVSDSQGLEDFCRSKVLY
ncbi:2-phosphoxylose phosphatase 1-like [Babylonia areolata]|uniref:2-phosphoxylose phosphatase 1-like n=1 Tax=Babylonia areolata TaxID=304850 RepID=UPI003FD61AB8